jgi:hypothetical protein
MKTLKQLREEHESKYVPQTVSSEQIVLESKSKSLMRPDTPSVSQMPSLLLFRRITYRLYPNKQVVALYYSKMVDKYLSIPFGPTGNLNLSESKIYDTLEELEEGAKWEAIKGGTKGGLQGAAKGFFKGAAIGAEPGAAIGAVVGGVKGAYKGAKRGLEKDREQNIKESFKDKLAQLREQKQEDDDPYGVKTAISLVPGAAAYQKYTEGDYAGAAKSAGLDLAMAGVGKAIAAGTKFAKPFIKKGLSKFKKTPKSSEEVARDASSMAKSSAPKPASTAANAAKNATKLGLAGAAGAAAGAIKDALTGKTGEVAAQSKSASTELKYDRPRVKAASTWKKVDDPVTASRLKTADLKTLSTTKENRISDIKNMISENIEYKDIEINGRLITLNTTMAKRILEVYDSVNTKNKKIVEGMLNEDLESFKKLLNFSIRN